MPSSSSPLGRRRTVDIPLTFPHGEARDRRSRSRRHDAFSPPARPVSFRPPTPRAGVSGGIEVALYWSEHDGSTRIEVWQPATEELLDFGVPCERALDAFYHPFAHLPAGCRGVSLAAA